MQFNQTFVQSNIFSKLQFLWADKRSFKKRLTLAAFSMAAFCFTFIFFGPIEIVAFGGEFLTYSYKDILPIMALAAFLVFAVCSLAVSLLKGKIFNYTVTLIASITVCGYIQALAFNGSLGALNGDAIYWNQMKQELLLNLFIWVAIIVGFYIIYYINRDFWKKAVVFSSILIISMQAAPTIGILAGLYENSDDKIITDYSLTSRGMYEFSSEHNILVFVLDRMDFDYIDAVLQEDPSALDKLDGFTGYKNAVSKYARTKPALNHLLTGSNLPAYTIPEADYLRNSWIDADKNILGDLVSQEYTVEIYTTIQDLFSDPEYVCNYVTNVTTDKGDFNQSLALRKMIYLSVYRYAPLSIKPFFWADTNFYNSQAYSNSEIYELDDAKYAPGFANITVNRDKNCFKFYHFNGPHEPFVLNSDGTPSDHVTSAEEQMMGTLHNLYIAFDALKQQGIYKNTTIIITADHGNAINDRMPLMKPTRIGLFYKPAGSEGIPFTWSSAPVSTENIPATILKAAKGDTSVYGSALDEIAEDADITREYYKSVNEGQSNASVYKYQIIGDASDFANWYNVDIIPMSFYFY